MHAYKYEAVVDDSGDVYCTGCLPKEVRRGESSPIFADSEWESAPVCVACGTEHTYMQITGGPTYASDQRWHDFND